MNKADMDKAQKEFLKNERDVYKTQVEQLQKQLARETNDVRTENVNLKQAARRTEKTLAENADLIAVQAATIKDFEAAKIQSEYEARLASDRIKELEAKVEELTPKPVLVQE